MSVAQDIKNLISKSPDKEAEILSVFDKHMGEIVKEFKLDVALMDAINKYHGSMVEARTAFKDGNTTLAQGKLSTAISYGVTVKARLIIVMGESHHLVPKF